MISINNTSIKPTIFPDQTSQIWKIDGIFNKADYAYISWNFENESEFMHLAQLKDLLDQNKLQATLTINFLPYARQDKPVDNGQTFALYTFAKLLNSLNFKFVNILDPHSQKALDLINNSSALKPELHYAINLVNPTHFIFPDDGAAKRYDYLYLPRHQKITARKIRSQTTGEILNYEVDKFEVTSQIRALVIDDICDGGATFIKLAEAIGPKAEFLYLYTTYGIYSKGVQVLLDAGYDRIFNHKGEVFPYENNQFTIKEYK